MSKLKVETLVPHMTGRVMHGRGDVYEEDSVVAKEKVDRGLVKLAGGRVEASPKPKATGPSANKAAKPKAKG